MKRLLLIVCLLATASNVTLVAMRGQRQSYSLEAIIERSEWDSVADFIRIGKITASDCLNYDKNTWNKPDYSLSMGNNLFQVIIKKSAYCTRQKVELSRLRNFLSELIQHGKIDHDENMVKCIFGWGDNPTDCYMQE